MIVPFFLLTLALLIGGRFLVQFIAEGRVRPIRAGKGAREVLIVGGGEGGRLVVRELMRNPQLLLRPWASWTTIRSSTGSRTSTASRSSGTTRRPTSARVLDAVEPERS